jgi:hypothetical protein
MTLTPKAPFLGTVACGVAVKWLKILNSILRGHTITEKFPLALQTLRGTNAALWQREWDTASPQIEEAAGIDPELQ